MSRPRSHPGRHRGPSAWAGFAAGLALVAGLFLGWSPASADTTPGVAPTPTTAVTAVTKSASSPVRVRATGPAPCDGDCPITLGLKYENQDAPNEDLRVGDTAKVTIVATNTGAATRTYGFTTYLDLNTADFQVLNANGTPASSGATGVFTMATSSFAVIGNVNTFTIDGGIGRLDLDANAVLASLPTGAELRSGETDLAWFRVRVRRNPSPNGTTSSTPAPFEIRVLGSNVGGTRNSVVSGGEGTNIMSGRTTSTGRDGFARVVQTDVTITAQDTRQTSGIGRVGDVIPVDIVLGSPTGGVRHVNAVQATITVASPTFRVVDASGNPIVGGGQPIVQYPDAGAKLTLGGATGTFTVVGGVPQVRMDITGQNTLTIAPNGSAKIGRLYVQALRKTTTTLSDGDIQVSMDPTDNVGERAPNGGVGFAPLVRQSSIGSPSGIDACTTNCATLGLGVVRGTTGVSLEVRSPMADTPAINAASPTFVLATDTFRPFLGVQGRYVDVAVFVDAASSLTHNREANRFDIDIAYDTSVFDTQVQPEFVPSAGFANRFGTSSGGAFAIRLDGTSTIDTRTEIGRLRLALKDSTSSTPPATSVWVVPSQSIGTCATVGTRIWVEGSPICDIYAGSVQGQYQWPQVGEFDRNAVVVNQPAAKLQIAARLQGRRPTDPSARFVQPVDVVLLRPGTTQAQVHQLTTATQSWNYAPVATASTTFSFTTSTASSTFSTNMSPESSGSPSPCESGPLTLAPPSNIVLAKVGSGACPINSIEPGTYDVYIKGQSSVGVLVRGVPFLPGQFRTLSGLTLREGDIEQGPNQADKVNIADFTAFSAAYNGFPAKDGQNASANWNPKADLNQSGFIDILDFSLLATNYGTNGASEIETIDLGNGLSLSASPATMFASASQTFGVRLNVGPNTLRHAVVSVVCASGWYCPVSTTPERVSFDGNATGQVELGQIKVSGVATGTATLMIRLEEAEGTAGTPASRAFFKASEVVTSFDVVPDVTWNLRVGPVSPYGNKFTAEIDLNILAHELSEGSFEISWTPENGLVVDPLTCPASTCSADPNAPTVTLFVPEGGLSGNNQTLGPVTFTYDGPDQVTGTLTATPSGLKHVSETTEILLVSGLSATGSATRSFVGSLVIDYAGDLVPTVSASRVRAAAVRTRSTSPNANLWVRTGATEVRVGDIIPVQVGVTTGVRAIDGAQVALKAAPGTRFVDQDGNVVTTGSAFSASGVLPNILRQAVDAGRGLLQVALGRTFASASSGVAGEGVLGTVYLEVTGPVSGDLVTIERTGTQNFTTMVAGDGDDLTGSLIGLSNTITIDTPVMSSPQAGTGPVIGGSAGVVLPAPSAPSGSARNATAARPASSAAGATRATTTTRGLTENRALGTISLTVPGRSLPVELRTGLVPMAPDQYCPVMRHQTYIRLQDVGIAGATFGVEPGGVLSWVSPDRAGCVDWTAISEGGLTFTKETIMQFQLARAVPGALLWVLDGGRNGELYEVDAQGVATYVTAEAFAANQDHFTQVWANVIPVSTAQIEGLAARGSVRR